ncbi:MAG: DUF368 domain-containing protein [Spirochaetia bacterium]|jgi:putative membrane protein|nr:DUF368 domain-containing protein [Spirochaetia bacterium]
MNIINYFLKGIAIGAANIIPGVSGGTLALVLGLYERILGAVNNIRPSTALAVLGLFRFNAKALERFKEEMKKIDIIFLIAIGAGAIASIAALAKLMTYLLLNRHDPTYGFFFGLVLLSTAAPYRLIKKKSWGALIPALAAAAFLIALSSFNADAMKEKAARAANHEQTQLHDESVHGSPAEHSAAERGFSAGKGLFFFAAGAVSISAMILPGISGSFILLLMGGYFDMLKAIAERDWSVIILFCFGCGIGLLLFTRLLAFLFKKFHDQTLGFLTGLVIGSLWVIWPFKSWELAGGEKIYTGNIFPPVFALNEILTLLAFLAGAVIIILFLKLEKH